MSVRERPLTAVYVYYFNCIKKKSKAKRNSFSLVISQTVKNSIKIIIKSTRNGWENAPLAGKEDGGG